MHSNDPNIDPVGACVGLHGIRVQKVVEELGGEKIDIIKWDKDPKEYIANALSPAKIIDVIIEDENSKSARVIVPDNQLSLAIGKEGQNARLAAKLTGWRIDIKSQSQAQSIDNSTNVERSRRICLEEAKNSVKNVRRLQGNEA